MKSVFACLAVFVTATSVFAGGNNPKPLEDSNAIVLSHGMLGWSDDQPLLGLVTYWGGMNDYLIEEGAPGVFMPSKTSLNGHEYRAIEQRDQIELWMAAHGHSQVNIIGHSQGGPDSRFMISNLGMEDKVAVMTSLSSPNKGAPIADIGLGLGLGILPDWIIPYAETVIDFFADLVYGDSEHDLLAAAFDMTIANAEAVNAAAPDMAGVKYYSYSSYVTMTDPIQHPLTAVMHPITKIGGAFYGLGTKNDGIVPVESAKHGEWKGGPDYPFWVTGVDHLQICNGANLGELIFDVDAFYLKMAKNAMNNQ